MSYLLIVLVALLPFTVQKGSHHWALEIDSSHVAPSNVRSLIEELDSKYHLIHKGKVGILQDVHKFHLSDEKLRVLRRKLHMDGDSTDEEVVESVQDFLATHRAVKVHHYQSPRERSKRGQVYVNDPSFPSQWHLVNTRMAGHDMDVQSVWSSGITGKNVTVCVIDDGLDHSNKDIAPNYNAKGSFDFIDEDSDPMPRQVLSDNHGTKCGGVIAAAANNSFCGVGVAYGARVSGVRILDNAVTDMREAEAFSYKLATNHIFSNSWGPTDDGKTVDGPGPLAAKVLEKAATREGRCGFGSVYVVASGNGGRFGDNCNFDGYANSMYTVTIGSIGENDRTPYYSEPCTATLGVTYSNGGGRDIATTDVAWHAGGCAAAEGQGLTGTSASAPMAAGLVALMLDARWCLTWRDVQFILVLTSSVVGGNDGWSKNAAGLSFHSYHGFGLLSGTRMVNAAKMWKSVPSQFSWSSEAVTRSTEIAAAGFEQAVSIPQLGEIKSLEYVTIVVTIKHLNRGSLEVSIVSPSGTTSVLVTSRTNDNSKDGLKDWRFSTVQFWGEPPEGDWTVRIVDKGIGVDGTSRGTVEKMEFQIYGSSLTLKEIQQRKQLVMQADGSVRLDCPARVACEDETYDDIGRDWGASFWTLHSYKIMTVAFLLAVALILIVFVSMEVYQKNKSRLCALFGRNRAGSEEEASLLSDREDDDRVTASFHRTSEEDEDDITIFDVRVQKENQDSNGRYDNHYQQQQHKLRLQTVKEVSPAIGSESQVLELAMEEPEFGGSERTGGGDGEALQQEVATPRGGPVFGEDTAAQVTGEESSAGTLGGYCQGGVSGLGSPHMLVSSGSSSVLLQQHQHPSQHLEGADRGSVSPTADVPRVVSDSDDCLTVAAVASGDGSSSEAIVSQSRGYEHQPESSTEEAVLEKDSDFSQLSALEAV